MRDADAERLRVPYESPVEPVPDDRRLNARLDFGIDSVIDLADQFVTDLDPSIGGIGWWQVYPELDRQKRAFISDYLASSARSMCFNLHESYVHRIELNHAVDDFKEWIERGIGSGQPTIPPPQNLYDDLSYVRVNASLAGTLRAFASSLDCIGACIVGVTGLPLDIVKSDLHKAKEKLQKEAKSHARLGQFQEQLERVEDASGPPGWINWLLSMRHMLVHRGRRIVTYNVTQGPRGDLEYFCLILPRAPELTEVQGWVYAGGQAASSFAAPAELLLARLSDSTCAYLNGTARLLIDLWQERKGTPSLIRQPTEQWREPPGLIKPVPSFNGYSLQLPATSSEVREVAVSDEVSRRMLAAGITVRDVGDVRPSPAFWY